MDVAAAHRAALPLKSNWVTTLWSPVSEFADVARALVRFDIVMPGDIEAA